MFWKNLAQNSFFALTVFILGLCLVPVSAMSAEVVLHDPEVEPVLAHENLIQVQ